MEYTNISLCLRRVLFTADRPQTCVITPYSQTLYMNLTINIYGTCVVYI